MSRSKVRCIKDVGADGGLVRTPNGGGSVPNTDKGVAVQKPKHFADVICKCPLKHTYMRGIPFPAPKAVAPYQAHIIHEFIHLQQMNLAYDLPYVPENSRNNISMFLIPTVSYRISQIPVEIP